MAQIKLDTWAYDISPKAVTKGEIFDTDVINASIESILSTTYGERLFNLSFGSDLPLILFENLNEDSADDLLDSILDSIERWEDRIVLLRDRAKMDIFSKQNSIVLSIPYIIKRNNIVSTFNRKVII